MHNQPCLLIDHLSFQHTGLMSEYDEQYGRMRLIKVMSHTIRRRFDGHRSVKVVLYKDFYRF
jgi:hypothetical protein